MANRSLVSLMANGLGSIAKANNMALVTDFRGVLGPIRESFPGAWQKNVTVEGAAALASYGPIYACATRISGDIAKLGLMLLQANDANGVSAPAPKASPYWTVLRKPNSFQNRIQFIRMWLLCKLLFGNAYAVKFRDGRGMVQALYLLDPRRVQPLVTIDGGVYYSISSDYLARLPTGLGAAPASEIIHDRGPTLWHPLVGIPPIYACALSGTLGLRIQQNSASFFQNMSQPGGILSGPDVIDKVTADRLQEEWTKNFSGKSVGKIAVMGNGLNYQAMAVAAEQSQLVEQLGLSAVDCATAYGMPAYKINQGPMPTNNNVQALNQQYYSDCLQTYIEDLELCLNEGLGVPDGYSVEFDLDGLLRMDSATQMDVLSKGVGGSILKPNEARRKLNYGPVAGGDVVYSQQQNWSLGQLDSRDINQQKPDKPAVAPPAPAPAAGDKQLTTELLAKVDALVAETRGMAEARLNVEEELDAALTMAASGIVAKMAALEFSDA